ncbi:MAG TPA: choice-of-anchor D domain-containing protein [Patescibacteria group bacterium]|nr:choice-of-anchor D domain-containing protein [Patescibacteria group bacterium]
MLKKIFIIHFLFSILAITAFAKDGRLLVTPVAKVFPNTEAGKAAVASFQVTTNEYGETFQLSATSRSGLGIFEVTELQGKELNDTKPITFKITFKPKSPGQYSDSIIIRINGKDDTVGIFVSGNAVPAEPKIVFSSVPDSKALNEVTFQVRPGEPENQRIRIKNEGSANARIQSLQIETLPPSRNPFTVSSPATPPYDIQPGQWKEIGIRFLDSLPGDYAGMLVVILQNGNKIRLPLYGRIQKPDGLIIRPGRFVFENARRGDIIERSVRIHNRNFISVNAAGLGFADGTNPDNDARFLIIAPQTASPGNRFFIGAKDSITITVRFTVADTQLVSNFLSVRFRAFEENYIIPIDVTFDSSPAGGLKVEFSPSSNFGKVQIGSDNTIQVIVTNSLNINVILSDFDFKNHKEIFFKSQGASQIEVKAGTSESFTITFKPAEAKLYEETFNFKSNSNKVEYFLHGEGIAPERPSYITRLQLNDIHVAIGDAFSLPILLEENKPSIQPGTSRRFSIEIRFMASTLYPVGFSNAPIEAGERVLKTESVYDPVAGNDLLKIPFLAVLGDMPVAQVRISNFTWLDDAGQPFQTDFTSNTITIFITGTEGRLVNTNKGALALSASPNPAIADIRLELSNFTTGATLSMYNMEGTLVRDLSDRITYGVQPLLITVPSAEIPEGVYFCRLTSGEHSIVRTIFVQRK